MQNKRKSKYSLKKKLDYIVHSFFKKHFLSYLFQTSEIVILEDTHSLAPYSWCMKIRNFALLTFQFHLLPFTCNPYCVFLIKILYLWFIYISYTCTFHELCWCELCMIFINLISTQFIWLLNWYFYWIQTDIINFLFFSSRIALKSCV